MDRTRTFTMKLNDVELAQVHALAIDGDESVGRMVRRWIGREYERRFGNATPPKPKVRMGRPKTRRR